MGQRHLLLPQLFHQLRRSNVFELESGGHERFAQREGLRFLRYTPGRFPGTAGVVSRATP